MKKCLAILSVAAVLLSLAACGGKTPAKTAESTTEVVTTELTTEAPTNGRYDEKDAYYLFIPDDWCKMEYAGDDFKIRLFNIPNAQDIEQGKTGEVMIEVSEKAGDAAEVLKMHTAYEGAKEGKAAKLGGYDFKTVTYTYPQEKRTYTVYVGTVDGGRVATVKLKGLKADDENVAKILRSITFKDNAVILAAQAKKEATAAIKEKIEEKKEELKQAASEKAADVAKKADAKASTTAAKKADTKEATTGA